MYQTILFDLDGTLTDPGEGITNSVAYALAKWNIHVEDRRELYRFIGPPLKDSFMGFYGFSEAEALRAVDAYREYFGERGIFENRVYPGVEDMLRGLRESGMTVVLATSKPELYANRILEHFHLDGYFDVVAGATFDDSRSQKADVIAYALEKIRATVGKSPDLSATIMIGDRYHDIWGAKANGIHSIGVLYGFGSRHELEDAGATYVAERVQDIPGIVIGNQAP